MTDEDHYREIASHALAGFQLIEASLKDYIAGYHYKVRASLPTSLTYEHQASDVDNLPLGKLVGTFDKINANKALVKKLRGLQSRRNDLAHRALVNLYGPARDEFDFSGNSTQLEKLAEELGELIEDILGEHAKLLQVGVVQNAHA